MGPFDPTQPSDVAGAAIADLRDEFNELWRTITQRVPDCRERSLALTNLEQACMWAVRASATQL